MNKTFNKLLLTCCIFHNSQAFEPVTTAAIVFAGWAGIKGHKYYKHKRINKKFITV